VASVSYLKYNYLVFLSSAWKIKLRRISWVERDNEGYTVSVWKPGRKRLEI